MEPFLRPLLTTGVLCALLCASSLASADVSSPGTKRVPYSFAVHGIPAGNVVLFAYSPNVGDVKDVGEGTKITAERAQASYRLYATTAQKRSEYDAPGSSRSASDLVAASVVCQGGPSSQFSLDDDDPRTSIHEDLDVKTLDATTCVVTSRGVPEKQGGCAIGGPANRVAPWLVALAVPLVLLGLRRRDRSKAAAHDDGSASR